MGANISLIKNNLCPLSFIDVPDQDYIDGILGVYEYNETILMAETFVWAYERSAARYSKIRSEVGEPDAFRFRYRNQLDQVIREVVLAKLTKAQTTTFLRKWVADKIPDKDQMHFINSVEEDLHTLHEGILITYKILPNEFATWRAGW